MSVDPREVDIRDRVKAYAAEWDVSIDEVAIGHGQDGYVYASVDPLGYVFKVFFDEQSYRRERNVYMRLTNRGVSSLNGLAVPVLQAFDNEALIVVMDTVSPPFLLDFASAQLDVPQSRTMIAEIDAVAREKFDDRWDEVASVLAVLRGMGIWLSDVNPNNIRLDPVV